MCHRLNNSDKGAVTHAVVHRALWEYLSYLVELENEVEREKLWKEIFEAYALMLLLSLTTNLYPQVSGCYCGNGPHERWFTACS